MDKYPLFFSDLIPFRAPPSSIRQVTVTPATLETIEQVTYLAHLTESLQIRAAPNIWLEEAEYTHESLSDAPFLPDTRLFDSMLDASSIGDASETFRRSDGGFFAVPAGARFFVIKLYNVLDVAALFEHGVWALTDLGNRRLDKAYKEAEAVFLFFLVNGLSKFCGVAQMTGPVDFSVTAAIWTERLRWRGVFPVEWLISKEVSNKRLRQLRVPHNDNKCVANSRDTQELPFGVACQMMHIFQ